MDTAYILTANGELYHVNGWEKENHKYIKREMQPNGKYRYWYDTPDSKKPALPLKNTKKNASSDAKNLPIANAFKTMAAKVKSAIEDVVGVDEKEDLEAAKLRMTKSAAELVNAKDALDRANKIKQDAWNNIPIGLTDKKSHDAATEKYREASKNFDDKLNDYDFAAKYTALSQKAVDDALEKYKRTPIGVAEAIGRTVRVTGKNLDEFYDNTAKSLNEAIDTGREYMTDWFEELERKVRERRN